jgi:stage II sporulation protein D
MITRCLLLLCMMLPLIGSSCPQVVPQPEPALLETPFPVYASAPLVRVLLSAPSASSTLKLEVDEATVTVGREKRTFSGSLALSRAAGKANAGALGGDAFLEINPTTSPESFTLDGRIYRGRLRLHATEAGWEVVNVVDLEEYVAGVIGWEMIRSWPVEALKAQALASRTYALFVMRAERIEGRNWDLDDTTKFQVYGGVGPADNAKLWRESDNVLAAREATTGQVLTYNGKGFKTFFHSTSGGRTTSPVVAFGERSSIPPLDGVDLGDFCRESTRYSWTTRLSDHELNAKLLDAGIRATDLIRITPLETAASGHHVRLRLFDRRGEWLDVGATDFRRALGLSSAKFAASREDGQWVFNGSGFGHGCGMCQWSARGMALAGWDATRIVQAMYPGCEVVRLYGAPALVSRR